MQGGKQEVTKVISPIKNRGNSTRCIKSPKYLSQCTITCCYLFSTANNKLSVIPLHEIKAYSISTRIISNIINFDSRRKHCVMKSGIVRQGELADNS